MSEQEIANNQMQAAEMLGLSVQAFRNLTKTPGFPVQKEGYNITEIREWQASQEAPESQEPPRGRQSQAPVCPYCESRCKAGRSEPFFTRYYCQSEDCSFSAKIPRPELVQSARRRQGDEDNYSGSLNFQTLEVAFEN